PGEAVSFAPLLDKQKWKRYERMMRKALTTEIARNDAMRQSIANPAVINMTFNTLSLRGA
ncbi:MAG: hypothetical protein LUF87_06175, partial [Alistipes sp.]|nr:hypothetical protein [Alistipes sp.]